MSKTSRVSYEAPVYLKSSECLHHSIRQARSSSPATLTASHTMRLCSIVRNSTPPWHPLGSCTLPGNGDWTNAAQAGCWTGASATPSLPPNLTVEVDKLGSTSSTLSPTRRGFLMSTHDTTPTVLEVRTTPRVVCVFFSYFTNPPQSYGRTRSG